MLHHLDVVAALVTSAVGVVTAAAAPLLAQAAAPDVAPWISAGGATAAVGGLVYVAKLLAAGQLVAVPVQQLLSASADRENRLVELEGRADKREQLLWDLLRKSENTTGPITLKDIQDAFDDYQRTKGDRR